MSNELLGWTFDTVADAYDKWRPEYIPELYVDIFAYSNISSKSNVMEIGIGTGQATKPFLQTGCNIIAIEAGQNLTKLVKDKFESYNNFTVVNSTFQTYMCENNLFDTIYSASAFHWIDEQEGYSKVYNLLKSNGVFARFASHPCDYIDGQEELSNKIGWIYFKYMPNLTGATSPKQIKAYTKENAEKRSEIALKYGFTDIASHLYCRDLIYNSDEYVKRISIESDKIALSEDARTLFLNEIKNAIDEHGGKIIIRDTIDLNLARKE